MDCLPNPPPPTMEIRLGPVYKDSCFCSTFFGRWSILNLSSKLLRSRFVPVQAPRICPEAPDSEFLTVLQQRFSGPAFHFAPGGRSPSRDLTKLALRVRSDLNPSPKLYFIDIPWWKHSVNVAELC